MRAPEAPIGWPSATAPPFTFTAPGRRRASRSSSATTDENASFSSTRSTSSIVLPAFSSAIAPGLGRRAREVGEVVRDVAPARRSSPAPRGRACGELLARDDDAPAPSFTPGALPAVVVPSGSKTGFSAASFSSDVSRRGPSSTATSPTGTISSSKSPSSIALHRALVRAQRPARPGPRARCRARGRRTTPAGPCAAGRSSTSARRGSSSRSATPSPEPVAEARLLEEVRRVRHRLHPAGDDHAVVAGADHLVGDLDRADARTRRPC